MLKKRLRVPSMWTDSANSPAQASLATVPTVNTGSAQALAATSGSAQPVKKHSSNHIPAMASQANCGGNKTVRIYLAKKTPLPEGITYTGRQNTSRQYLAKNILMRISSTRVTILRNSGVRPRRELQIYSHRVNRQGCWSWPHQSEITDSRWQPAGRLCTGIRGRIQRQHARRQQVEYELSLGT